MDLRSVVSASIGRSHRRRLAAGLAVGAIVLLALVMSIVSLALATSVSFPDVPASHPYYAAITDLASRSIIGGYANGNFGPADPVTRQQFAKMIVLTGGYPVSESDVCPFTDVAKGGPTTLYPDNYIAVCAAKGITTGTSPTTFNPTGKITRYQVVSMVVRMADNLQPGLLAAPPATWSGNATWAANPTHGANAARAEYNGLLTGLDLATLAPTGNMSRGEVAQVLHNLLAKLSTTTTTTTTGSTTTTTEGTGTRTTGSTTPTTLPSGSLTWTPAGVHSVLPPAREAGESMAYDPDIHKVILFGGWGAGGARFNDTWAYDPATSIWTNLNPSGILPSARGGQSMVYDPLVHKVIMFGGSAASGRLNDTWAYDPSINGWTNLSPAGVPPLARVGQSMVCDSSTSRVILFGGQLADLTCVNDTWVYDPAANSWTKLTPTGTLPTARENHSMVYDLGTHRVVMFGGDSGGSYLNDAYAYDPAGNGWTGLNPSGTLPSARGSQSMVYDPDLHEAIMFGGWVGGVVNGPVNDTWVLNP